MPPSEESSSTPSLDSQGGTIVVTHEGSDEQRNATFSRIIQAVRTQHGQAVTVKKTGTMLRLIPSRDTTHAQVKTTANMAMHGVSGGVSASGRHGKRPHKKGRKR